MIYVKRSLLRKRLPSVSSTHEKTASSHCYLECFSVHIRDDFDSSCFDSAQQSEGLSQLLPILRISNGTHPRDAAVAIFAALKFPRVPFVFCAEFGGSLVSRGDRPENTGQNTAHLNTNPFGHIFFEE